MKTHFLLAASAVVLSGCASGPPPAPYFVPSSAPLSAPPADQAQIVFVDPANEVQGVVSAFLFELHGSDRTLLAVMGPHSKSVQLVAPGHHIFASNGASRAASIMQADVVAGKRYYVLLRFVYMGGMQLRPIRPAGPSPYAATNKDFADWLSGSSFYVKTPAADAFVKELDAAIAKEQAAGLVEWDRKLPAQRAELTLDPADAIDR